MHKFSTKKFDIDAVMQILEKEMQAFPLPLAEAVVLDRENTAYKVLISTILSARTKDSTTITILPRLFAAAPTAQSLARLPVEKIEKLIFPVGFYRTKARHLKAVGAQLVRDFGGAVPQTMDELQCLPGVGRKTANIVLNVMFRVPAIAVDVHVHRISNRFGYVKTKTTHDTERALLRKLPKKYWGDYNRVLVLLGQNICRPTSPHCTRCPVNQYCQRRGVTKFR